MISKVKKTAVVVLALIFLAGCNQSAQEPIRNGSAEHPFKIGDQIPVYDTHLTVTDLSLYEEKEGAYYTFYALLEVDLSKMPQDQRQWLYDDLGFGSFVPMVSYAQVSGEWFIHVSPGEKRMDITAVDASPTKEVWRILYRLDKQKKSASGSICSLTMNTHDMDDKLLVNCFEEINIPEPLENLGNNNLDQISQEMIDAANKMIYRNVYWTPFGHVYHTHKDCEAINQNESLMSGTVEEAIAANRTRLCKYCAERDGVEGIVTNGDLEDDEPTIPTAD